MTLRVSSLMKSAHALDTIQCTCDLPRKDKLDPLPLWFSTLHQRLLEGGYTEAAAAADGWRHALERGLPNDACWYPIGW